MFTSRHAAYLTGPSGSAFSDFLRNRGPHRSQFHCRFWNPLLVPSKPARRPLPAELLRETELLGRNRKCVRIAAASWINRGEDVSEMLEYVLARFKVKSRNPLLTGRSNAAWQDQAYGRMCWGRSIPIIFRCISEPAGTHFAFTVNEYARASLFWLYYGSC